MSNTTQKGAVAIHGKNPQFLIEKVIRSRIWDSMYWKEQCFALTAVSIIDKAAGLRYVGGTFGGHNQPSEFLCLVLKLLQLQPDKEIILEYLRAEDFKYLRALAAFYIRLTFDAIDIYETLEPMLDDYRKLRYRAMDGSYSIVTMDEFVDQLLREERVCEVQLPRVTMRKVLEESEGLPRRRSQLAQVMGIEGYDDDDDEEGSDGEDGRGRYLSRSPSLSGSERGRYVSRSPSRSGSEGGRSRRSRSRSESSSRSGSPDDRDRYISRSPSPAGYVSRSPTRSPEPEGEVQTAMPVDH